MFSSEKKEGYVVLTIEVQSGAIRGSLAVFGSGLPVVIFSHFVDLNIELGITDQLLIERAINAIKEIIDFSKKFISHRDNIAKYGFHSKKIHSVHFILSSPWIVSEAKTISKRYEKDIIINKKFISDLVKDECDQLSANSAESVEAIERKIYDVKLNNYSIADWENRSTKTLDVSFTVSIASSRTIEYFIDQFKGTVNKNKIFFHSSLFLQHLGIETLFDPGQSYCLLHVHDRQTDISLVKRKSCSFFGYISIGSGNIVDELIQTTHNGKEAVESLIALYSDNRMSDDELNKKERDKIDNAFRNWLEQLKIYLIEKKVDIRPPTSVVITAGKFDSQFTRVLSIAYSSLKIYILSTEDLISKVVFADSVERRGLTSLYIVAIHSLV